jgi:hypothetical protein
LNVATAAQGSDGLATALGKVAGAATQMHVSVQTMLVASQAVNSTVECLHAELVIFSGRSRYKDGYAAACILLEGSPAMRRQTNCSGCPPALHSAAKNPGQAARGLNFPGCAVERSRSKSLRRIDSSHQPEQSSRLLWR